MLLETHSGITINLSTPSTFHIGHAQSDDWKKAVRLCLQQLSNITPDANLGFVYASEHLAEYSEQLLTYLRTETGIQEWVGTVGGGICATGMEYYDHPSLVIMIGAFPEGSYQLLPFYNRPADHLTEDLMEWIQLSDTTHTILHGDPENGSLPELLVQLDTEIPHGTISGAISGSQANNPQYVGKVTNGGFSGVMFNDQVRTATVITQGCSPINKGHVITKADHNVISLIDNRPALDVFKEDIGEILARDLDRAAGYIFAGLSSTESLDEELLVRNIIGIDHTHGRIAIADIANPNQRIQFCKRDGKAAFEDLQRMLTDLKNNIGNDAKPRGALYFSCMGRGRELFGNESQELRFIQEQLGDIPLAGFFANGEIFNHRLYGYTGVLTIFL